MATKHYENGIVATTGGGDTDIQSDIFVTGAVYYVNSTGGNDANAGTNRNLPKATLASAISAATASNGDIIILEAGHAEVITSAITVSKAALRIMGLGTGSSKPSFTINGNVDMFDLTAALVELNGLRFPVGTAAHTARVNLAAAGCRLIDIDFLCGANDLNSVTIPAAGLYAKIKGCTWTISADGPDSGILVESASAVGLEVDGCSFDGGSYDFDDAGLYSAQAHTGFIYRNNTLTNKASIIHTAAAKGLCIGTIAADTCRVEV